MRPTRLASALGLILLAGCRSDMYDQPHYKPLAASAFFADGKSARPLVEGTVPRGGARNDTLLYEGKVDGKDADLFPWAMTEIDLKRGRDRFLIYCAPCHGATGDGQGIIVRRGFSPPPPLYGPRPKTASQPVTVYDDLRKAPAGHFFDVITNGHGAMYSYAARITVEDRWRITAYIRALQLSQHATVDDLRAISDPNEHERRLLREAGR